MKVVGSGNAWYGGDRLRPNSEHVLGVVAASKKGRAGWGGFDVQEKEIGGWKLLEDLMTPDTLQLWIIVQQDRAGDVVIVAGEYNTVSTTGGVIMLHGEGEVAILTCFLTDREAAMLPSVTKQSGE
jgi:hypothetical protein